MSAYLEDLIRDLRGRAELAAIDAKMKAHYDGISAAAIDEESDWGRVGAATLSNLED